MKYLLYLLLLASPLLAQDDAEVLTQRRAALEALEAETERYSEASRFRKQRIELLEIELRSRERALGDGPSVRNELLAVAESAAAVAAGYAKLTEAKENGVADEAMEAIWDEVKAADDDYNYAERRLQFTRGMQRIDEQLREHGLQLDEASIAKGAELSKQVMDARRELDKEMNAFREKSDALEKDIRAKEAEYGDLLETLYERVEAARLAPDLPPTPVEEAPSEEAPASEENTTESPAPVAEEAPAEAEPEIEAEPEAEPEAKPEAEAPAKSATEEKAE